MGKFSREKGKRGERNVVKFLRFLFKNISRDLNDVYKKEGIDLLRSGGFAIQVKHYAKHVPLTKYNEIQPSEKDDRIPLLVSWPTTASEGKPLVVMSLEDFSRLLDNPKLAKLEREE